jgi:hypothetical protein
MAPRKSLLLTSAVVQSLRSQPRWVCICSQYGQAAWWYEYLVIGANDKGLILADRMTMSWVQAAQVAGKLSVEAGRKEGLLDRMRRMYAQANGARPHIATVGKAIAAL